MTGNPEGSTESGFMEKLGIEPATPGLQGSGGFMVMCVLYDGKSRRLNRKWFYGEAGNRTCDPWFTRHSAYPLHQKKKLFVAFPWVETSTGPGGFMSCVFII